MDIPIVPLIVEEEKVEEPGILDNIASFFTGKVPSMSTVKYASVPIVAGSGLYLIYKSEALTKIFQMLSPERMQKVSDALSTRDFADTVRNWSFIDKYGIPNGAIFRVMTATNPKLEAQKIILAGGVSGLFS